MRSGIEKVERDSSRAEGSVIEDRLSFSSASSLVRRWWRRSELVECRSLSLGLLLDDRDLRGLLGSRSDLLRSDLLRCRFSRGRDSSSKTSCSLEGMATRGEGNYGIRRCVRERRGGRSTLKLGWRWGESFEAEFGTVWVFCGGG